MKYFAAGAEPGYLGELAHRRCLISYAESKQHGVLAARASGQISELILDSGAFTVWTSQARKRPRKPIQLADYIAFVHQGLKASALDYAVTLDVIPGTPGVAPTTAEVDAARVQTLDNLDAMLYHHVPRKHLLPVFHFGMPFDILERYVREGFRYIALGGLVKRPPTQAEPWVKAAFQRFRPESWGGVMKYHILGVSARWVIALEPYSIDSTTWLQFQANGFEENMCLVNYLPRWFCCGNIGKTRLPDNPHATPSEKRELGLLAMHARVAQLTSGYPEVGTPEWEHFKWYFTHQWHIEDADWNRFPRGLEWDAILEDEEAKRERDEVLDKLWNDLERRYGLDETLFFFQQRHLTRQDLIRRKKLRERTSA